MKRGIARKWVVALKSGKYKQARSRLKNGDNYCCLGVLCNLYEEETGDEGWENYKVLPPQVRDWAGMQTNDGTYGDTKRLTRDNDTLRKSFTKIANIIKENVDNL